MIIHSIVKYYTIPSEYFKIVQLTIAFAIRDYYVVRLRDRKSRGIGQ